MRFSCDKCLAKYTIADEKVRGKIVAVKCSKCGNRITVNGKSLVAPVEHVAEESTRVASLQDIEALRANLQPSVPPHKVQPAPAPPPPVSPPAPHGGLPDGWHAIIDRQQVGPLTGAEVASHIASGKIGARTYLWRDGQGDWKRASDLPLIAAALAPAPAPPPPAAAAPPAPKAAPAAPASPTPPPRPRTASSVAIPRNGAKAAEPVRPAAPQARAEPRADAGLEDSFFEEEDRPTIQRSDIDPAALDAAFLDLASPGPGPGEAEKAPAPAGQHRQAQQAAQQQLPQQEQPAGAPASNQDLNALLFDDAQDMIPTGTGKPITDLAGAVAGDLEQSAQQGPEAGEPSDPFASVPDNPHISKPGEIGEQTRYFMQKAGVNRRNPPWKIALFVVLLIALPISGLYLLSKFNVKIPFLQIQEVDESTGQAVTVSVFSEEGVRSLRDRLLKRMPKKKPAPRPAPPPGPKAGGDKKDDGPLVARPDIQMGSTMTDAERQQMREALDTVDKDGPKVDESLLQTRLQVDGKAGLDNKQITEVYAKNAKAFQGCVETEVRRNPQFGGGKVQITFTIGTSGVVTAASIDRPEIDRADIGGCLKEKAKRMVFPSFEGDPIQVELPLILAKGN